MAAGRPKRPRNANQLAKLVLDLATGEIQGDKAPAPEQEGRKRAGNVGGKARAEALTPERGTEIARKAARARWARARQK